MSVLASDPLNGGGGDIQTSYNGKWTYGPTTATSGAINVQSTGAYVGSATNGLLVTAYYSNIVWPNDQWAQVTINSAMSGVMQSGVCVRNNGTTAYYFYGTSSTYDVRAYNAGSVSLIGGAKSWTPNVGDVLYIQVTGQTSSIQIIVKQNSTVLQTTGVGAQQYASGSAGLAYASGGVNGPVLNTWSGGNFSSQMPQCTYTLP